MKTSPLPDPIAQWKLSRSIALDTLARQYLTNPSSLQVARRNPSGHPLSFLSGNLLIPSDHVFARAEILSATSSHLE